MKVLTLIAAAMLVAGSASAAPLHLSLDEAVRRGLSVGEEILLSASAVREAAQQVKAARSAVYPQIDGVINYNRTIRTPYSFELPEGASLPFGQPNLWIAQVTVNQTLYAAGKLGAGLQIAKDFLGAAEANAREQRQTIVLAIEEAYHDAALAGEMAAIAASSGRLMDAQLAHVRLLKQAGNASELDVLRVQVERENLQPEITAAQNARDVAMLNLLRLVNLPAETDLELDNVLTTATVKPVDVISIVDGALERRPAVAAAQHLVDIRKQQVRIEKADLLPTVGATAIIGEQATPEDFLPSETNSDWSVGVGMRVPIFDGGRRRAEVRAAQEVQRQAELQLAQLREGVTLEIEQQRRELARATEQVGARAEAARQAQHAYELTELSYRAGNATQLDLTNARAQLRQATGNLAVAVHDHHLARCAPPARRGLPAH